jgi:hypothetical protein
MRLNQTAIMDLQQRLPPPPDTTTFALFSGASLGGALLILQFDFVPILDHINLAFHESGHAFFGLLGNLMHWLGGTLGQFVFPLACLVHFLRRAQLLQAAACAYWACENLRYVAFYLGDARSRALPLVGGGEHDWAYLLGRWGLLEHDRSIAGFLVFLSWSGWLAIWAAVAWWWWLGRQEQKQQAELERRQQIIAAARQREAERPTGPQAARMPTPPDSRRPPG